MRTLTLASTLVLLTSSCKRTCGSYDVHTAGVGTDPDGQDFYYDFDDGFEECRSLFGMSYGTTADLDSVDEDGFEGQVGVITFDPAHDNWTMMDVVYMYVKFERESWEVGSELDIYDPNLYWQYAYLRFADGAHVEKAALNLDHTRIEVLEHDGGEDTCSDYTGGVQHYRLRWEVLFGERDVQPWYATEGEDWVELATDSCE